MWIWFSSGCLLWYSAYLPTKSSTYSVEAKNQCWNVKRLVVFTCTLLDPQFWERCVLAMWWNTSFLLHPSMININWIHSRRYFLASEAEAVYFMASRIFLYIKSSCSSSIQFHGCCKRKKRVNVSSRNTNWSSGLDREIFRNFLLSQNQDPCHFLFLLFGFGRFLCLKGDKFFFSVCSQCQSVSRPGTFLFSASFQSLPNFYLHTATKLADLFWPGYQNSAIYVDIYLHPGRISEEWKEWGICLIIWLTAISNSILYSIQLFCWSTGPRYYL